MSILTTKSLEFARAHLERYYDSDFFPKPFEFKAMWHCWTDVKKFIQASNVNKLPSIPSRAQPWPKPKGGYRIVHQLEPMDALIYTALVYQVAPGIEAARHDLEQNVACSYRIALDDDGFFAGGSGYEAFRVQSLHLAETFSYVLLVDVADFYNQVNLHRVNNAIEHSNPDLKSVADDTESLLSKFNSTISQGLPVGPAASIVLAEAIMIDIDQHIEASGHPHCRYVDDFRIFANSESSPESVLSDLTLYLYQNHRLSVASDKTRLIATDNFVSHDLNNPYELEKLEVFAVLGAAGGYGSPEDEDEQDIKQQQEKRATANYTVVTALTAMIDRRTIDLGYCRALIRQARALKSIEVAVLLLKNPELFAPVANNVFLFLNSILTDQAFTTLKPTLDKLVKVARSRGGLYRLWFEWFVSENEKHLGGNQYRKLLFDSPFMISRARNAVITKDLAWVRVMKNRYYELGPSDRRAILFAASILPEDEKKHWLKDVITASLSPLEKWVATYVIDGMDKLESIDF